METNQKTKRKQLLLFLLAFIMIIASVASNDNVVNAAEGTEVHQSFSDVAPGHWVYDYVEELAKEGTVSGRPDGSYGLNDHVKRQHVAKMVAGALDLVIVEGGQLSFADVPASNEFAKFIAATEKEKIFGGKPDGSFGWNENITRRQIANVIVRAFGLKEGEVEVNFNDIEFPNDPEATKNITILASNGIVKGYENNTIYNPSGFLTRAQFAKILVEARNTAAEQAMTEVVKIDTIPDKKAELDGTYKLPVAVQITLSDDTLAIVPVTWDNSAVNLNKAGMYEVVGTLDISDLENVAETDLKASINIIVGEMKEEKVQENEVDFSTTEQEDNTLPLGETEVLQEGVNGYDEVVYSVGYVNGIETGRTEISRVTVDPTPKIIKVGTRVDVESILLSHSELTLTEGENISLSATVLPENATNKNLLWSSSDENIVSVNEQGVVQANSSGEATITVTDSSKNVASEVVVIVKEPTIDTIEDIMAQVTQYDNYKLPTTVTALMSNGATKEYPIDWSSSNIDTSIFGIQYFEGTVEGYDRPITLTLEVKEYDPQLLTNAYSAITISNLSKQLNLNIHNFGTKHVNIDKIEVYERGILYSTYTPQRLIESGIDTVVQSGGSWGISITYKLGLWLDNSYVKYYLSVNNTSYDYEITLDKN